MYNAHGNLLTAFERDSGLRMSWLGNPGAFSHCYAVWHHDAEPARLLEFDSYAVRYAHEGLPVHGPRELQPHYPWSLAWRDGPVPSAVSDILEIAHNTATARKWHHFDEDGEHPWLPHDDPVAQELGPTRL
jgi:hypothetical protein